MWLNDMVGLGRECRFTMRVKLGCGRPWVLWVCSLKCIPAGLCVSAGIRHMCMHGATCDSVGVQLGNVAKLCLERYSDWGGSILLSAFDTHLLCVCHLMFVACVHEN